VLASPHIALTGGEPFFGSPTKIFEYMALSVPTVASRLGQIAEVLEHDRTALLVTPGDEHELAAAISALLADPARGKVLAEEARREVESAHTWDDRAESILRVLGRG
jgi:glycosyltransferase involved in cell wall biosynthesis